jgi:hypothetical protein
VVDAPEPPGKGRLAPDEVHFSVVRRRLRSFASVHGLRATNIVVRDLPRGAADREGVASALGVAPLLEMDGCPQHVAHLQPA